MKKDIAYFNLEYKNWSKLFINIKLKEIKMKKTSFIIAIILLIAGFSAENFAQQFAPWAKLSSNAPKDISSRNYPVPTKEEVGISPYPGAFISSLSAPSTDTTKYKQEVLPFVILVSSDSPGNVVAYYKRILTKDKGWTYSEEYRTFVKGQTSQALTGFVPSVAIRDENGENFDLVYVDESLKSRLRSRIEITYKTSDENK